MARTSSYGNMLNQLPNWVFGGEFGQISNLLTDRDQRRASLMQTEQQNDLREIALEDQRRQEEMDRKMREMDIFGGNDQTPATLRDMYGRMRDVAKEMGSYEDVLKMQEKIENLDRQKQLDDLNKTYREAMTEAAGRRGTGGGRGKTYNLINATTGEVELNVNEATAEALMDSDSNWIVNVDPDRRSKIEEAKRIKQEAERKKQAESQGPGIIDRIGQFFGGKKPADEAIKKQVNLTEDIKNKAAGVKGAAQKPTREEIVAELERRRSSR